MRNEEVEWRRLRADQLRQLAADDALVLVPVGSLEQHGPHLPVEVDSMLGETVALRTARLIVESEPVVVLPCIWTGISEHHMSFGGTISLDFDAFIGVIRCVCQSLVRHGFKRIVLLNGHGGNDNALRVACDELSERLGVPLVHFTYWYAAAEPIEAILETQKALLHACEAETSMMMVMRPELVAEERIELAMANRTPDVADLVGGGIYRWRTLQAQSSAGVVGNPAAASREKGERLFKEICEEIARKLTNREFWELAWH